MANFTFGSPDVKVSDKIVPFATQTTQETALGVITEAPLGPAFEPILIRGKSELYQMFGKPSYQNGRAPMQAGLRAAEAYLEAQGIVYVNRVLGLSGFVHDNAWSLTGSLKVKNTEAPLSNLDFTATSNHTGMTSDTDTSTASDVFTPPTTGQRFKKALSASLSDAKFTWKEVEVGGAAKTYIEVKDIYLPVVVGQYVNVSMPEVLTTGNKITKVEGTITCYRMTLQSDGTYVGAWGFNLKQSTWDAVTTNNLMPLALIRSNKPGCTPVVATTVRDCVGSTFTISCTVGSRTTTYTVTLDPESELYMGKVIPRKPSADHDIYLDKLYDANIDIAVRDGVMWSAETLEATINMKDYREAFRSSRTPWLVSEVRGSLVEKLFYMVTISDGDSSSTQVKVSVENIDIKNGTFDILIRDFNDRDDQRVILEKFPKCSMVSSASNYVGKMIGAVDTVTGRYKYPAISRYVYVVMNENHTEGGVPCGFHGIEIPKATAATTVHLTMYKTSYLSEERLEKTYLGMGARKPEYMVDFLSYHGKAASKDMTMSQGFHLDSRAKDINSFGTVKYSAGDSTLTSTSENEVDNVYQNIAARKFTVCFYGGFDGWKADGIRSITEKDKPNGLLYKRDNDWEAYASAISGFSDPERYDINLLVAPGLNWYDNKSLCAKILDMLSLDRKGDAMAILDPPQLNDSDYALSLAGLMKANDPEGALNSPYGATYGPWLTVIDKTSTRSVDLPPSVEMVRVYKLNDKQRDIFWAPAGSKFRLQANALSQDIGISGRDVMYANRINAITKDTLTGINAMGQRNLLEEEQANNRINVVRLMAYLKKVIRRQAKNLLFEQNDMKFRDDFVTSLRKTFQRLLDNRGINRYELGHDNGNPENVAKSMAVFYVQFEPTSSVEFIGIEFSVTPAGVDFVTN